MFPCASFSYGLWWIFPLFMFLMLVLCFFMMRGMGSMMRRGHGGDTEDSAPDRLKKRYARGELNNDEYERKRREITEHS